MISRLSLNLCSWSSVIGQRSLRLPLRHYAASFSSGTPAPRLWFRSSFAVENPSVPLVWPRKRLLSSSRWCWKRILSGFCVEVPKEQASGERRSFFHLWGPSSWRSSVEGSFGVQGWEIGFLSFRRTGICAYCVFIRSGPAIPPSKRV